MKSHDAEEEKSENVYELNRSRLLESDLLLFHCKNWRLCEVSNYFPVLRF